uniref:AMP-activated protein kinase glycogen-binding domain-containing protein n=1 Tax=Parascaris univalens TaxID=6257 RepID=A0A915B480_PARUN
MLKRTVICTMISDAFGLVFGPIAVHSSHRFSEAMARRRSRWHIAAITRWVLQCVSPVQLLNVTVQAASEPRKENRQEAIILLQEAIRLLQQKEEQHDPYAKLKNATGITCMIFVMFCILYAVFDITVHLFNCIRNSTPYYLPPNPEQRARKTSRSEQLAEIAKAVKNRRLKKDNAKHGPLSEPPLDDLINTVERSAALRSIALEASGKRKQEDVGASSSN